MTVRVTFVLPDFFAGGAQKVLLALAAGTDENAFAPSIVVINGEGPWRERVAPHLPITDLKRQGFRKALPALCRTLRAARPDIIVSTMGYLNLGLLALKPLLPGKTRFIVREANRLLPESAGRLTTAVLKSAYPTLYRRACRVVSPSKLIADELVKDFHVPARLVQVLPNPVAEEELRTMANEPKRPPGQAPQFVCVGRLSRQKAYDRLLDTLAQHEPPGHVTIFGEGPERESLETQCRALGLEERVTFAGFNANPAPWVAGADALLLPSRWEGLPNVALEALACGTPVIAAPEAGGIGEIAERAAKNAVTLAPLGADFAAAMGRAAQNAGAGLRASLLPDAFRPAAVNAAFNSILKECAPA